MKKFTGIFTILILTLSSTVWADWGNDTLVSGTGRGSYCDLFSNGEIGRSFEIALSRYQTRNAANGLREGCSYGINLMPSSAAGIRATEPVTYISHSASSLIFNARPSNYHEGYIGPVIRQCDSNTRRCVGSVDGAGNCPAGQSQRYEAQYCENDPTTHIPDPSMTVLDVSDYTGTDSCPIKVQDNAYVTFRDFTIAVKEGTDISKVFCDMNGVELTRNVYLSVPKDTQYPTNRPHVNRPKTVNTKAQIYDVSIVISTRNMGMGSGGGGGSRLSCDVSSSLAKGSGYNLRVSSSGTIERVTARVGRNRQTSIPHVICETPQDCRRVWVNPLQETCYGVRCSQNGEVVTAAPVCVNPLNPGSGGMSGSGGMNPGTGGMSGSGGMNPGTGGMSGSGGMNPGTGGMSGSGGMNPGTGGMSGSGGGNVGSLDCHLDVSPTATGYRLSWVRANTSSISLSRNGSPVTLAPNADFLDVPRTEITAQQTYVLTLTPENMSVTACAATTEGDRTVILAPSPTCSFPIAEVIRNNNGSYQVGYTAGFARGVRFTEGAGAPSSLTPGADGTVRGSFTTPVITSRSLYSLSVEGLGSLPSNTVCSLILESGNNGGTETAPVCSIGPVAISGNAYQVTYTVGADATVTQLQKGTTRTVADAANPEALDFSQATVNNGAKSLVRSEQVSATTVYRLTARKSASGPACVAYQTLTPLTASTEDPDPDHDGICNIRVTPAPTVCVYFDPPANDGPDRVDNCPFVSNPTQDDSDFDGLGDACDPNPAVSDNPEAAYAEGSGFSCQMMGTSKAAEAIVPFLVIIIGFVFFKIGFGKSARIR